VLVYKKGRKSPAKLMMFTAHMDEVGFIITNITSDGYLRFGAVGGITPAAVFGRRVVIEGGGGSLISGVIAGKPVHLLTQSEKDTQPKLDDLLIDIGAANAEEAESRVKQGDYAYFVSDYAQESKTSGRIRGKAIDNRLGCAIMLDLLAVEPEYDCVFAFTVQEEVGCRGAGPAAFNLEPDICVVLEATTACDIAEVADKDTVCKLGAGAVISFMDKGAVYDRKLFDLAAQTAKDNNIKWQVKNRVVGGNDASVIHTTAGGVRTLALSAPCRYLHTANCVVDEKDVEGMRVLAEKLLAVYAMM
jgi:endoglucanase